MAVSPVSLSLEKVTNASPLDTLQLITLKNYSGWLYLDPQTNLFEWHQVPPLVITIHSGEMFQLDAKCSVSDTDILWLMDENDILDCHCEFNVTPINPIGTDWTFESAMGFVDANGDLRKLFGSRDFNPLGEKFTFERSDLDKVANGEDLKLFLWISKIATGRMNDQSFEQQFDCTKEIFSSMQSTIKSDLFCTDKYPAESLPWSIAEESETEEVVTELGFRRYASKYRLNLETFERIFDSGWLPSCFNFGDSTSSCAPEGWMLGSVVLFHSYAESIRSGSAFSHILKSTNGHEWLLTVNPGDVEHEIVVTTAHLDERRFLVLYGFGTEVFDKFKLNQEGLFEDVGRISSPRLMWDENEVNNCVQFRVSIYDISGNNAAEVVVVSNEGRGVKFYGGMFDNSSVIQDMMEYTKPNKNGRYRIKVDFDTVTLHFLHLILTEEANVCDFHRRIYCNSAKPPPLLMNLYKAADFFHLPDVKSKVESLLGYKPKLPIP